MSEAATTSLMARGAMGICGSADMKAARTAAAIRAGLGSDVSITKAWLKYAPLRLGNVVGRVSCQRRRHVLDVVHDADDRHHWRRRHLRVAGRELARQWVAVAQISAHESPIDEGDRCGADAVVGRETTAGNHLDSHGVEELAADAVRSRDLRMLCVDELALHADVQHTVPVGPKW